MKLSKIESKNDERYVILRELGKRLKFYRNAAGITQSQMAQYCNVTPMTISLIERGETQIKYLDLCVYSSKCKVSLNELTGSPDTILEELHKEIQNLTMIEQSRLLTCIRTIKGLNDL